MTTTEQPQTFYCDGTPHELRGAKPGDTVYAFGNEYVIGQDGRLQYVGKQEKAQ